MFSMKNLACKELTISHQTQIAYSFSSFYMYSAVPL